MDYCFVSLYSNSILLHTSLDVMKTILTLCLVLLATTSVQAQDRTNSLQDQISTLRGTLSTLHWKLDSLVSESPDRPKNTLFAEIGGNGGYFSVNYDYRFHKQWSVRAGVGLFQTYSKSENVVYDSNNNIIQTSKSTLGSFSLPLMVNFSTDEIGHPGHFELGLGVAPWLMRNVTEVFIWTTTTYQKQFFDSNNKPFFQTVQGWKSQSDTRIDNYSLSFFATAMIGYRYQPIDGGLFVRIGFTPSFHIGIDNKPVITPLFGLGVGHTF